jgi:N-acetylglucosamine kinase-like BadF-type ATPase
MPKALWASSEYFLIADSGATHTRACLASPGGEIIRYTVTGPGNAFAVGWSRALTSLREALGTALHSVKPVGVAVLGSASVDQHGEGSSRIADSVRQLLPRATLKVLGDMRIALEGAFAGGPGIVIVSGTGSVIFGKADESRYVQVGGWGALFGDEGSAQWIAREALRRAAHAVDGIGPATRLPRAFQKHFGAHTFQNLLPVIYQDPSPASLGVLAVLVVRLASTGDRVARTILRQAGEALAVQAAAAARRLPLVQARVSCQGSVFSAGKIILQPLRQTLKKLCPDARLVPAILPPLGGAWLLALQTAGMTPTREAIAVFHRNYHAVFEGRLGKS